MTLTIAQLRVLGQSHKDNVHCTAVEKQPEAKEVQLSQSICTSPHDRLFWANLRVHSSSSSLLLISYGTLNVQLNIISDCFYTALEQTQQRSCRMRFWMTVSLYLFMCVCIYYYPPKWCTDSTIWLLHGWCYVKLLLSRCMFCVHHTTNHQFTASFHSKPYR